MITRDCEVVWSEWRVGGYRLCVHGKHPAAHGRIGKQMGHRERVCGVTSGDHYIQSEQHRKCRPIEIDGTRLLPYSFE